MHYLQGGTANQQGGAKPYLMPEQPWIDLRGTVNTVEFDLFVPDDGEDSMTLSIGDGDRNTDN